MGRKAIAHYQKLGIDPLSKVLVFSDNLDTAKAVDLYRHFASRVKLSFGIGTRLTCDLPQVKPLNIVIKLVECNGKPVAKLSDSPGKLSATIRPSSAPCAKRSTCRRLKGKLKTWPDGILLSGQSISLLRQTGSDDLGKILRAS